MDGQAPPPAPPTVAAGGGTDKAAPSQKATFCVERPGPPPAPPIVDAGVVGEDAAIVVRFQEFLRIPSVSAEGPRNGSYKAAADFIVARCREALGDAASVKVVEPITGKPIVVATVPGQDAALGSIWMHSHYDVVPVMRGQWSCDPFGAEVRDGYVGPQVPADMPKAGPCIYARGAQDMKCVCMQYLEALRRLRSRPGGWTPRRNVHLTFMPDEEVGGAHGMAEFLMTPEFSAFKPVALALDEGLASQRDVYTVFYGERTIWWVLVRAEGPTGHGSRFIPNTAAEKLMGVINKALAFRSEQEKCLGFDCGCKHSQAKKLGDVTTVNLTMLKGGVSLDGGKTYSLNVIPTEMEAGFDVRISPNLATAEFKAMLDEWCREEGLSWKFAPWTKIVEEHHVSDTNAATNPFWGIFEEAVETTGKKVEREIFPAATDSRLVRELGMQALGFSPMANTPILLHEHNEALSVSTFLSGIRTYEVIIDALAGAERQKGEGATKPQNGSARGDEPDAKRAKTS